MRINFHKGMSGFEAKKAINYELEAHSHGGLEEEDEDREEMGGLGQKIRGREMEEMVGYDLS